MKCIAREEIPNFEGFTRALDIRLPEGTIVNPRPPAACAARAIVGWRAIDVLLGVFAQIVPDKIPAAGEGGVTFPAISGMHRGRQFVLSETLAGSWGAMPDRDGTFGIPNPGGNLTNQPVEMIEALHPLEVERYGMVENSGGAGPLPRRAGLPPPVPGARAGRRADSHALRPAAVPALRPERRLPGHAVLEHRQSRPRPADRAGHADGRRSGSGTATSSAISAPAARGRAIRSNAIRPMSPPIFAEERITSEYAEAVYGVVLDAAGAVDPQATAAARVALRRARENGDGASPAYLRMFQDSLGLPGFRLEDGRRMVYADGQGD